MKHKVKSISHRQWEELDRLLKRLNEAGVKLEAPKMPAVIAGISVPEPQRYEFPIIEIELKEEGVTSIGDLECLLRKASHTYYTTGQETMTDQKFDALRDLLEMVNPSSDFLIEVGALEDPNSGWPKAKHEIQMGSLEKCKNIQEMTEWYKMRAAVLGLLN